MDPQMAAAADTKPAVHPSPPRTKPPVVRGARACTVCRQAKMKCVGAEDGQKPCQRCKRASLNCVFEKHRRGRKPGSKLSEASKMLRRLEKGLNSAKLKSHSGDGLAFVSDDARNPPHQEPTYPAMRPPEPPSYGPAPTSFANNELPAPNMTSYQSVETYNVSVNSARTLDMDDDDEDPDRTDEALFPATLIKRENQRNSFFRTILNPEETPATSATQRSTSFTPPQQVAPVPSGLSDPISAGIITEDDAKTLFDAIFLRLNPFINLFDPALHTVSYVRSKCPFLFTTLIMAGCKFFKAEKFKQCQKLANEFAVRAFAESWKRVEVVQAFACLTYWKDPDDTRTWTFIGYACRMAVELGLNRYVHHPPPNETAFQKMERRNRERTYLILFVHDRSLSMQTGRHWMLPEDDLVRNASTWHETGPGPLRPEDVIVAAFVLLRRIAAETTDVFHAAKALAGGNTDINYDLHLTNCNTRLTQWDDTWRREMTRAHGEKFHFSFLTFFRLYVRLFLNSFGIQASMLNGTRQPASLQALSTCCTSALDSLHIVSNDFHEMHVLRYGQDSITVMSAYSAVFLLRLLRGSTGHQLVPDMAEKTHSLITQTADSYQDASAGCHLPVSISASYHARFLRSLVSNDIFRGQRPERERHENGMPIDPRLQGSTSQTVAPTGSGTPMYPQRAQDQGFHFPASPHLPAHPQTTIHDGEYAMDYQGRVNGMPTTIHYPTGYTPAVPHSASELDAHYWKNMFIELGFGHVENQVQAPIARPMGPPGYLDGTAAHHQQGGHHGAAMGHHPMVSHGPMNYHTMHTSHSNYGN